jgi:ABC-2 type transport system permease protein
MGAMLWRMWRMTRNTAALARTHRLRALAMCAVLLSMWALIGGLVLGMLWFLGQDEYVALKARLTESLLSLFFLTLLVFVTASDAVLVWAALFRTRAGAFQAALPLADHHLWSATAAEGGFWAGWSIIALAVPLVAALATEAARPLPFIVAALLAMGGFLACCMAGGSVGALLLARIIPVLRKRVRWLLALGALAAGALVWAGLAAYGDAHPAQMMGDVVGRLRFAENPWLPSRWAQQAVAAAQEARWADWLHHLGLLATTAGALAVVGELLARLRLRRDLDALAGRGDGARAARSRPWRLPPLLPRDLALLMAKDWRLFLRDPAQVLQFVAFFAMLAFYMLMLPRLGRAFAEHAWWAPVVSILNLAAVAMALATFTGRFVYPLLALEGRRLWVLALAPWPRRRVVTAKLLFALAVGMPVSVGLVALSGTLLHLAPAVILYQGLVVVCLAVGLSAGALGLGARLADYGEDNPAKLVSGYGGTVNLLVSLAFTALLISGAAVPVLTTSGPQAWILGAAWSIGLAAAWSWLALRLAWRWFGELDRNPTVA